MSFGGIDALTLRLLRGLIPGYVGDTLAQRIQRAAFFLTMLLVGVLGAGMLVLSLVNLRAATLNAHTLTLQTLRGDLVNQLDGIANEMHYLSQSPLVWTAISDSAGRDAYLRPYLRGQSGLNRMTRLTLLDYRGRLIAGGQAPLDPDSDVDLRLPLQQAQQHGKPAGHVVAKEQRLILAFPVVFPYTQKVIGVLLGEVRLDRLVQARAGSLGENHGLALRHDKNELLVFPGLDGDRFLEISLPLASREIDGLYVFDLELFQRQPVWLISALPVMGLFTVSAALLVWFVWTASHRLATGLTRRLDRLAESVQRGGDPETLPEDLSDDEIGLLSRVLKDSLRANRDFTRTLEERVARRTSELAASEAKYRFLAESIKDVVWTLDTETLRFLYVSPSVQGQRGYTPAEVLAAPLEAALMPWQVAALKAEIVARKADFLSGAQPPDHFYTHLLELPCKDGGSVWAESVTRFRVDEQSSHVIVLGVSRDISERRRAEELQRFAAFQSGIAEMGISVLHNIGNAITAVTVDAEALTKASADLARVADLLDRAADAELATSTDGPRDRADAQRRATLLREAAAVIRSLQETGLRAPGQRIADSVRHIADMVRIQQNATLPDAVCFSFDLGQALRDVLLMHEVDLQRGGIVVELLLDPDLPPLTLPRNALLQALMHSVGNACRAIRARTDGVDAGRLEIHAERLDPERVRISFIDNGIGFEPAQRATLFQATAEAPGLHATALFAQEIGGRVELDSPGPGQGARLLLELPLMPRGAKARIMCDADASLLTVDGMAMRAGPRIDRSQL